MGALRIHRCSAHLGRAAGAQQHDLLLRRAANIALVGVLLMTFVVAAVSLPLMVLSGGA